MGLKLLAEGKTKRVWGRENTPREVLIESKDDVTAGDGARREQFEGKGAYCNSTALSCFRLLTAHGIPNHFIERVEGMYRRYPGYEPDPKNSFLARRLEMIPIEVVVRRVATGSYLKRRPDVEEGTRFNPLVVEFFQKDDSRHDPLIIYDIVGRRILLYDAKRPLAAGFLGETSMASRDEVVWISREMVDLAERTFRVLEEAWADQSVTLVDLKIECGVADGRILVGDVITNDEWRIWPNGEKARQLDKQVFREMPQATKETMAALKANYAKVAEMAGRFRLPKKECRGIITRHSTADP